MRKVLAALLTVMLLTALMLPASATDVESAVSLPVTITVSGINTDEIFTVMLSADNINYPMPLGSVDGVVQVSAKANETVTFDAMKYSQPGSYTYTVFQKAGSNAGIAYDSTIYDLTVTVTYEAGAYQAVSTLSVHGSDHKAEKVAFENTNANKAENGFSIVKTSDCGKKVNRGDVIEYTFVLTNNGSEPIKNIRVRDYIPENTTYVAGSATNGGEYGRIGGKDHITWNIPSLAVGQTLELSFKVTVDQCISGTMIKNTAFYETDNKTPTNDPDDPIFNTNHINTEVTPSLIEIIINGNEEPVTGADKNNGQNNGSNGQNSGDEDSPITGDYSAMYMWIAFTAIVASCVIGLSFLLARKRKVR